jgi:hypothetical protein
MAMITKRDKQTDPAAREEQDGAERQREEWQARATREAPFQGEVDPASMVISPHTKPKLESETKTIGGAGDPRVVAANAVDTPTEGTETPWRDTPPTNVSSTFETNNDHSPPHDPDTDPDDLDSMHEDLVPPEQEGFRLGQDAPPVETRSAVEVFPPERESGREPARPRRTNEEMFPPEREPVKRKAER